MACNHINVPRYCGFRWVSRERLFASAALPVWSGSHPHLDPTLPLLPLARAGWCAAARCWPGVNLLASAIRSSVSAGSCVIRWTPGSVF